MNRLARLASDVATSRLFRSVEVAAVDDHGSAFRLVRFGGESLQGVAWVPGQKVQIRLEGFSTRTYTPISWDPDRGATAVLAYTHDAGPGSQLMRELEAGEQYQFFGPRSSVDLTKVSGTPLLVGDETSFGLAAAWQDGVGGPARMCFEAQDPADAGRVLEAVGLAGAEIVPAEDGGLAGAVEAALQADPDLHLVLTGRAQSIKRVRAHLKDTGRRARATTVKAYWDEKRAGLD